MSSLDSGLQSLCKRLFQVHPAVEQGFKFHHAKPDYVLLTQSARLCGCLSCVRLVEARFASASPKRNCEERLGSQQIFEVFGSEDTSIG